MSKSEKLKIFIFPPLLFAVTHIGLLSLEYSVYIRLEDLSLVGVSKNILGEDPRKPEENGIGWVNIEGPVKKWTDNISRSYIFLNIQPNIIRHDLYIKNTILARISYTDLKDGLTKEQWFGFDLSCKGKDINADGKEHEIKEGLRLNDESNNDKHVLNDITTGCLDFPHGGFKNDTGQAILFNKVEEMSPDGKISLTVGLDPVSRLVIFVGWYVFWFGLVILVRDGPGRYIDV